MTSPGNITKVAGGAIDLEKGRAVNLTPPPINDGVSRRAYVRWHF